MKFDKASFELTVFNEFCRIVGLHVNDGAIQQLPPPQPDVRCLVDGIERRFELTLLTEPSIEKKVRQGRSGSTNFKIEVQDVVDRIREKSLKKYADGPAIELVLHEGATPIDDLWMYEQVELDCRLAKEAQASPFGRIWLVDISNEVFRSYVKTA